MANRDGDQIGLWVTYIPSTYVVQMRQAWWGAHEHAEQMKTDLANQKAVSIHKADQEKVE